MDRLVVGAVTGSKPEVGQVYRGSMRSRRLWVGHLFFGERLGRHLGLIDDRRRFCRRCFCGGNIDGRRLWCCRLLELRLILCNQLPFGFDPDSKILAFRSSGLFPKGVGPLADVGVAERHGRYFPVQIKHA